MKQDARSHVHTYVQCVRPAQNTAKRIISEFPEIRVHPSLTFVNVGADIAGPYILFMTAKLNLSTRARQTPDAKDWRAVVVCLASRAVHLESTKGLSLEDFPSA